MAMVAHHTSSMAPIIHCREPHTPMSHSLFYSIIMQVAKYTPNKNYIVHSTLTDSDWKQLNHISALFHTIIGAANDIAHSQMLDCIEIIKTTGHYRWAVKKNIKQALAFYQKFERANYADMKGPEGDKQQLYMDYLDNVSDRMKPHVFKFYMSIKQFLDKQHIPNSSLKANILCTAQLLVYAVFLFDKFIEECPPIPTIDLRKTYFSARLYPMVRYWEIVLNTLCPDCANINFEDDTNCKLAFDIIESNIVLEEYIDKSGKEALNLNPEVKNQLNYYVDKRKAQARTRLRKAHGYIIPTNSDIIYYNNATTRVPSLEKRYVEKYHFEFKPQNQIS